MKVFVGEGFSRLLPRAVTEPVAEFLCWKMASV